MAVSALTSSLSAVVTPHAGLHRRSNCGASYCSDRNHLHMDMGGDDDPDDGTTPIIYSSINKSETELTDDIYTDSGDEGYTLKKAVTICQATSPSISRLSSAAVSTCAWMGIR